MPHLFRSLSLSVVLAGAQLAFAQDTSIPAARLKSFHPLPASYAESRNPTNQDKVRLGRMLYYEPRLSVNQKISCNTCHKLDQYGVDQGKVSLGFKGQAGARNSPTVYNAAGQFAQFWDGRAADVEAQAKGPVMNPVEMAMTSEERVIETLNSMPGYVQLFKKAFPGDSNPVTFDNVASAIGVFERGLVTPARWDKFLEGDQNALTTEEKAGFNKFYTTGCVACHNGTYFGGAQYQRLGLVKAWPDTHDQGRFALTGKEADRGVFKVPSLRNVDKTGPYYHDGNVDTLPEAIRLMGEYQVGKQLSPADIASIDAFLKTLTGELPASYIQSPSLPQATAKTPKPISE